MIPALIPVSLDNCRMLECTVFLTPCAFNGMNNIESQKGEIVMYQPDETIRLEVRMGEETVWLTQQQMADLFNKDRTVIGRLFNLGNHIRYGF